MSEKETFEKYAPYFSLGLEIAVGIAGPILLGYFLDQWLETSPWLLLTGCVVGMVNVFVVIFRLFNRLGEQE